LGAAAVAAEEAVERKEARCAKPWLSELDAPKWQELAGDQLEWKKELKSTRIQTEILYCSCAKFRTTHLSIAKTCTIATRLALLKSLDQLAKNVTAGRFYQRAVI
jgi:hypothetical protein